MHMARELRSQRPQRPAARVAAALPEDPESPSSPQPKIDPVGRFNCGLLQSSLLGGHAQATRGRTAGPQMPLDLPSFIAGKLRGPGCEPRVVSKDREAE